MTELPEAIDANSTRSRKKETQGPQVSILRVLSDSVFQKSNLSHLKCETPRHRGHGEDFAGCCARESTISSRECMANVSEFRLGVRFVFIPDDPDHIEPHGVFE